jgi:hypothetical protein
MHWQILFLSLLFVGNVYAAADTVYEWTDENGVVHYSSQPPPADQPATEKLLQPIPMVGTEAPHPRQDSGPLTVPATDDTQNKREALARKRIEATSYQEALAVECEHASGVLGSLQQFANISLSDAAGNTRVMPEPERKQRIQLAQDFIRDNCR